MEINAASVKLFFCESKFRRQKNGWEKNKLGELSTKVQKITDNAVPVTTESPLSSEWEHSTVRLQNFKYEHRDFTHSWRLRNNNNNFYLNVTEWLASPGGNKFLKPIEEMSKEELNVFLKRFCTSARKKDGTLSVYKSSSMKSTWEPPLIVSFAFCRSTNRFSLSLTPLLIFK